ncbi:hypothetical protein LINGRAHAP2_LOCUS36067 [Linum grandiflorum]
MVEQQGKLRRFFTNSYRFRFWICCSHVWDRRYVDRQSCQSWKRMISPFGQAATLQMLQLVIIWLSPGKRGSCGCEAGCRMVQWR